MTEKKQEIQFNAEGIPLPIKDVVKYAEWLKLVLRKEDKRFLQICYTFCDDEYLLKINREYLQHDYYTDIITFPYSYEPISTDIFISVTRVNENAQENQSAPEEELLRVIVHGLLHMCGYDDHSPQEIEIMRAKESTYIKLFNNN